MHGANVLTFQLYWGLNNDLKTNNSQKISKHTFENRRFYDKQRPTRFAYGA